MRIPGRRVARRSGSPSHRYTWARRGRSTGSGRASRRANASKHTGSKACIIPSHSTRLYECDTDQAVPKGTALTSRRRESRSQVFGNHRRQLCDALGKGGEVEAEQSSDIEEIEGISHRSHHSAFGTTTPN